MMEEFKLNMLEYFDMIELGLMQYFLELEVRQQGGVIVINHKNYAKNHLQKLGMLNCKLLAIPINTNEKLRLHDSSGNADEKWY